MTKNYVLLSLFLLAIISNACKTGSDITKGDEYFKYEQYKEAIDVYKQNYAGAKKDVKPQLAFKIAEAYRMKRDYPNAEKWYTTAQKYQFKDPELLYRIGEAQKMNEKYAEALKTFQDYKKERPSDTRVEEQIEVVNDYLEWQAHPKTRFVVENLRIANSPANDLSPSLLKKEGMVFTSDREGSKGKKEFGGTGEKFTDLWMLPKTQIKVKGNKGADTFKWAVADLKPLEGTVNSEMNEGQSSFDEKGNVMYYTFCNPPIGTEKKKFYPNCQIFSATRKGKEWAPDDKPLSFCTDTTVNYRHPAISPDGTKMVFAMSNYQGKPDHDLFLVTYVKRSRTWSDPVNLGPNINTSGDEVFPYFYNDTTLFFASDGHIGLGGLDLFVSTGEGETWSKPRHLGYPLNSGGDDFGIVFEPGKNTGAKLLTSNERGYFTSNRNTNSVKSRNDDIYQFYMTPLVFTLSGIVTDSVTHKPLNGAKVTLINKTTGQKQEVTVDKTGKYFFKLTPETEYTVGGAKNGYFPSKIYPPSTKGLEFSADLRQDLTLNIPVITVHGILYDLDKANIRPDAKPHLDSLVGVMNTYPNLVVELGSHTDCRASVKHNDSLSQARSDSAVAYIISRGIDKERIVAKGYGEHQLLNNCHCDKTDGDQGVNCTEEQHQANRRTTVTILRWDYEPKEGNEQK